MVFILDTAALMNTSVIGEINKQIYTTPSVIEEIKSLQARNILDLLLGKNILSVLEPDPEDIQMILSKAISIGQKGLSDTDVEVLALSLKFDNPIILSDDFGLRNIAHHMNIQSQGITSTGGEKKRKYKYQCKGCGKYYKHSINECDICGHTDFKRYRK